LLAQNKNQREYAGRNLTGLDKVLFDRIIEKVGKQQYSRGSFGLGQTVLGIAGNIPLYGAVLTTALHADYDNALIKLEKSFTIDEVKEIVKEVGVYAGVDNTQMLTKIKESAGNKENEYKKAL
jgi:hypothetical protein